jgi:phytoene synthase
MRGPTRFTELDAAGITDATLRRSYLACRRLNAEHGRTYFLATMLLPPWKRPYVHALYGFARYADEIVDDLSSTLTAAQKAAWLRQWSGGIVRALRPDDAPEPATGLATDPDTDPATDFGVATGEADRTDGSESILPAMVDTVRRWSIPSGHVEAFLRSMAMDLTVTSYETWDDLLVYIHGSAAVIGLQMLPILEPTSAVAEVYARDLGTAFQLANFLRDVGEDLRRGRIYLPMDSLRLFGVSRERLARGVVDGPVRRLLSHEISRCREIFRSAEPGIRLLHPTSRDCIRTAFVLYGGILDEIERADYQVLDRRVSVGLSRRLAVAGPAFARARAARRASERTTGATSGGTTGRAA